MKVNTIEDFSEKCKNSYLIELDKIRDRIELINSYRNYDFIIKNLKNGKMKSVNAMEIKKNKPVIIVGSGYSLNAAIPDLKEWKHDIICSPSQFSTLIYHGIIPTYIMLSGTFAIMDEFAIDSWDDKDMKFVVSVSFSPPALRYLVNKKKMVYIYTRNQEGKEFLNVIKSGYHSYDESVSAAREDLVFKDLIDADIKVNNLATILQIKMAERLGYNPIILIGADSIIDRSDIWYYKNKKWQCIVHDKKMGGQSAMIWDKIEKKLQKEKRVSEVFKYKGKLTSEVLYCIKEMTDNAIKKCTKKVIDCSDGILEAATNGKIENIIRRYK